MFPLLTSPFHLHPSPSHTSPAHSPSINAFSFIFPFLKSIIFLVIFLCHSILLPLTCVYPLHMHHLFLVPHHSSFPSINVFWFYFSISEVAFISSCIMFHSLHLPSTYIYPRHTYHPFLVAHLASPPVPFSLCV